MFSLLDLLRQRRQLQLPEVLRLLASLPGHLLAAKKGEAGSLLDIVRVRFVGIGDDQEAKLFLQRRVEDWPPFILCLVAIAGRGASGEGARSPRLTDSIRLPAYTTTRFARLLYELLGGPNRAQHETYFPPLAVLSEAANALLNVALTQRTALDATGFWREFVEVCGVGAEAAIAGGENAVATRTLQIFERRAVFEMGSSLSLTPAKSGIVPWKFVARSRFRIGRSPEHADYVARFLPETAANVLRTSEISRVHVVAEVRDERLVLRDGNGSHASVNGSEFDGITLSAEHPTPLENPGVLSLGADYFLRIVPVFSPELWEIVNPVGWLNFDQLAPPTISAVLVEPIGERVPPVRTAWLLNRAGFHLAEGDDFILDDDLVSPGIFFFRSSCFLLANISLPEEQISLEGSSIARGEAVPLRTGHRLRIGSQVFTVKVE
ncbi:MAG: hypothetical protein QOE70_120 [Chthoniobacter sp.]|jgi:hypothetical protein|nr:hypothetical protein [Chthoniobacter sp.]